MPLILTNQALVLKAYSVLVDETPGNVAFKAHQDFIAANGVAAYSTTLDSIFAAKTTAELATTMLANLGLASVFTQAEAEAYLTAYASNRVGAMLNLADALYNFNAAANPKMDAAKVVQIVAAKAVYVSLIDSSYNYSVDTGHVIGAALDNFNGTTFELTTGRDLLSGTALNDLFNAYVIDSSNTLQSADVINGGAGTDTLFADIASQSFAILAQTKSIENATFHVQQNQTDTGDNNIAKFGIVDAERMDGVLNWEDNGSRADLIIEDVRIQDKQITKDITISMVDTDPGHVDFGVYFDQNSLRNVTASTSVMTLRVLDTYNTDKDASTVAANGGSLKDSPYGSFSFWASSDKGATFTKVTLASDAMRDALTVKDMVAAMQAQADLKFGAGNVVVALGSTYSVKDPVTGHDVAGTAITVTAKGDYQFDTTKAGSGWLATEVVPATSGLYTDFGTTGSAATDLVTSTVILDNVGRGSTGGDLVIGGLSVGDTSNSKGVQEFDITVKDNSRLETIQSTNNTLQVVKLVNGETSEMSDAYRTTTKDAGYLIVNGNSGVNGASHVAGTPDPVTAGGNNEVLPGTTNSVTGATSGLNAAGFTDVRVIDASAMTGSIEFTADITEHAVSKYVNLVDTAADPTADNIDVVYSGGANNDKMVVDLDEAAVASHSNINVGREDFTFVFNGNAGNDTIDVAIDRSLTLKGNAEAWYTNQKANANITINGGDGDDTIRKPGAGDAKINGDAGNDTIYADNTGAQTVALLDATGAALAAQKSDAQWVFNTTFQTSAVATDKEVSDLVSDGNDNLGSFGASLTVNYRGLTSKVAVADTTDYKLSDLEINQAIKKAINTDAVLSKLLVAEDGPANTLVVKSLIDGVHVAADLGVTLAGPSATDISVAALAAYNAANGTSFAAAANMLGAVGQVGSILDNLSLLAADYTSELGVDTAAANIIGANSATTSDNVITGGTGNDVIVLGTTVGATALLSSNDTVVYSAAFGNDTIVNFTDATANAFSADKIDFTALGGKSAGFVDAINGAILAPAALTNGAIILDEAHASAATHVLASSNDTAAYVKELFTDGTVAAAKGVYIAVDAATNVGTVYQVVDGTAANDLTVTLMGSINLADGSGAVDVWAGLTGANFA